MIDVVMVGGPYDGAEYRLGPSDPMLVPLRRLGPEPRFVEIRPVETAQGWRLYWPRGAS